MNAQSITEVKDYSKELMTNILDVQVKLLKLTKEFKSLRRNVIIFGLIILAVNLFILLG